MSSPYTGDTGAHEPERATYDIAGTETKWQRVWDELQPFKADDDSPREKRYALTMFPYPSGDLHMGHAEVFALHDVVARYWWQRGYEVLNPMGFDSFGLPAENAAIRHDEHPDTYTRANIARSIESCQRSSSGAWPTARTAPSTGARTTRPCWPTSRSSAASATAAARR